LFPTTLTEKSTTSSFTQLWHWTLVKFIQLITSYLIFRAVRNFLQRTGRKYLRFHQIALIGFVGGSVSTIFIYFLLNYTDFLQTERSYLSFLISNGLMGAVWLPICCAASVAFRRFTEMNDLLNSKLSINVINEIKQSQLFKDTVENENRITSNQIIKIIQNSKGKADIKNELSNVGFNRGFNRGFNLISFKDYITSFFSSTIKQFTSKNVSV
jgi:hypothetical protein